MKVTGHFLLMFLLVFLPLHAKSQHAPIKIQPSQEKLALHVIDAWLEYQSRFTNLPGLQICIRKKGKIIFSKAYGYANIETKRALKTTDLFHIASLSKTFTTCAILQLVDQGALDLQEPVVTYVPELKNHKDKRFAQITLQDLLSNRSGLLRDGLDCEFWDMQTPFPSREDLVQEILEAKLVFPPNEHTKYSNVGFALLGLVLENVLGIPFQDVMNSLIFKKLPSTHLLTDYAKEKKEKFVTGYSRPLWEGQRLPFNKHASALALAPATGLCGNAEDTSGL